MSTKAIATNLPLNLVDGLFIAAFLAHIPVGLEYALRMWRIGHYQFFPLLMVVAGWLIYDRVSKLSPVPKRSNLTYGLLAVNTVTLLVAVLLYSPFFWILSFMFLIAIFVFDHWGRDGVMKAMPAWLLILFVVPLPSGLDLMLVNKMQFLASQLASWILDAFGQIHFREGVILITEKKQFFTEEACSGIRSLFSSLAAIAIFGVMRGYPPWRHVFNLCQTVVWVIVGNAIRVAIVVYVSDNWYEGIASGTAHEMLGLAVFLFIFFLALSTDRAINAWQSSQSRDTLPDNEEVEELTITVKPTKRSSDDEGASNPLIRWSIIGLFALVAVFAGRLTYVKMAGDILNYYTEDDLLALQESDLPEEIDGWKRVKFDHQLRDDARLLAPESFIWSYSKNGRKATISLDSPYYDFHNLNDCYAGLGWNVEFDHRYRIDDEASTNKDLTVLTMKKSNENGVVLFTAFDRNGKLVIPRNETNYAPSRVMVLMRNIRLALGTLDQETDPRLSKQALPISQVQLTQTSGREIDDLEELENLFLNARNILKSSDRFSGQSKPPEG